MEYGKDPWSRVSEIQRIFRQPGETESLVRVSLGPKILAFNIN